MPDMDLGIVIKLVGILIAVVALISGTIFAMIFGMMRKSRARQLNRIKNLERQINYNTTSLKELVYWVDNKQSIDRMETQLTHKVLRASNEASDIVDNFETVTKDIRNRSHLGYLHLKLLSSDPQKSNSALKELVNSNGNARSLELLLRLKKKKILTSPKKDIAKAIRQLKNRLNHNAR